MNNSNFAHFNCKVIIFKLQTQEFLNHHPLVTAQGLPTRNIITSPKASSDLFQVGCKLIDRAAGISRESRYNFSCKIVWHFPCEYVTIRLRKR